MRSIADQGGVGATAVILRLTAKRNQRDFPWPGAVHLGADEPDVEQILAAARQADATAPLYLAGGEPTLRRDIFALIDTLSTALPERELVLLTNGRIFFYERSCAALAATGAARLTVEVWMTATRRDVHERIVEVAESLDQADRGLQNLLARGLRARVRMLVGRQNHTQLHEVAASLGDRYGQLEHVVWDVATLAGAGELAAPLDEVASYLETALTLQRRRRIAATVDGLPACLLRAEQRALLGGALRGAYRDVCGSCSARPNCPGLPAAVLDDPSLRIAPVGPPGDAAAYDAYLADFLAHYTPPALCGAAAVLDAMCGQDMPNLAGLRRFFAGAAAVHGTDIELDPRTVAPPGTAIQCADLLEPLATDACYDVITVFKPPGDAGFPLDRALAHLFAVLRPGGCLLLVLAEHTEVEHTTAALRAIDADVAISERNPLRSSIEPEHKWVIVCRAPA